MAAMLGHPMRLLQAERDAMVTVRPDGQTRRVLWMSARVCVAVLQRLPHRQKCNCALLAHKEKDGRRMGIGGEREEKEEEKKNSTTAPVDLHRMSKQGPQAR